MVKIKRKVEMTYGEFAKYMVDKFGFSSYVVELSDGYWLGNPEREYDASIHLPPSKVSDLPDIKITKSGVVIFEVEEEITEDMKLDLLLDHMTNVYGQDYVGNLAFNESINDILKENDELEIPTKSIHLFDRETKEFKLIWHDGKLVE